METKLYIGEYRVELDIEPSILYSYTVTDYSNPTAVRNGHSKTVTIKGSPNNNKIFGHYFQVDRRVGNDGPNAGIYYNASKKAPFMLFVDSELYESGYVRLDKINKINNEVSYDCTLFSGLGDFFYNLAYNNNTGDKLKLADLDYYTGGTDEFDFTVTATTINEAWTALRNGTNGKWQHINFMPAYNGKPSDFNADKVIINLDGTSLPNQDESGLFRPLAGDCVIADLPEEMTEWEMRDLRSYLQRPCIRMKSIIDACCNPDQNGGYEVELDRDFFNDDNAYYTKTWLSLPMMQNLEYANQEQVLEGSTLVGLRTSGDAGTYMYQDLKFDIGDFNSTTPSSINVDAKVFVNFIWNNLNPEAMPIIGNLSDLTTPYTSFAWFWNRKGDSYHSGWWCLGSLFVQLIAMNGETVVGASNAYNLTSPIRHNGKLYYGHNGHYSKNNKYNPYCDKEIYNILGNFQTDGFHKENSNVPYEIRFHIDNLNSPVSALKVVYFWGATDDKIKHFSKYTLFSETEESSWIDFGGPDPDWYSAGDASIPTVGVTYTNFKAVLGESLGRSGTKITKSLLLNTKDSPMDYLLSYAKTFGLYFTKVLGENKVKIETRKTFYHRDEVVNLNNLIDRGKDIKINPITFNTKWYELSHEMDETEYSKKYESAKGVQYGSRILNTGYEFDVKKEKLLDNSVIRSGIEGLERSKFFSAYNNDNVQRSWMGMGLHYNLYLFDNAADVNVPVVNSNNLLGINENEGMKYYDIFPKMQFHKSDNEPSDGNNVLVFFSGFKDVEQGRSNPISYYLSDDNAYQTIYNDGTPCWLFTAYETVNGQQIARKVRYLPVFERYLTNNGSGTVDKSLDFGTAQEIYIPDYILTEDASIYQNFWADYLEDLFDPDTKVLECYVKVDGKIGDEWLRRFYWFDNTIWRLNKVTDWEVGSSGTTQMEFIKVQSISGYNSITQGATTVVSLSSSSYGVSPSGETVTLYVGINTGGNWRITATDGVTLSRSNGTGNGTLTATIPSNNTNGLKYWYFTVSSDDGATARCTIAQSYEGETDFTPNPANLIVPASGGNSVVNFVWANQGSDYVVDSEHNEGSGYAQFTVDLDTYMTQNKAVLNFSANTGNTVLHNFCQFQSENGLNKSIGIDQAPSEIVFDSSGGSATLEFEFNTGVTITGPEWVTITKSGNTFTFTARPNYYETENTASFTISNGSQRISVGARQGAGGAPTPTYIFDVSPTNIYFTSGGGTQFITITATQSWYATVPSGAFFTISTQNGGGNMTVGVTAPANSGSQRNDYVDFTSTVDGVSTTKRVYVSQSASGSSGTTPTISVSPNTTSIAQSGESITYTVTVSDMHGLTLDIVAARTGDGARATIGNVNWQNNVGTVTITYPSNDAYNSAKTWGVQFKLMQGSTTVATKSLLPTQAGASSEYWDGGGSGGSGGGGSQGGGSGDSSGGTSTITPTTNTCWYTQVGDGGDFSIGLQQAQDAFENAIDTGILMHSGITMRMAYTGRGINCNGRLIGTNGSSSDIYPDNYDWRFFGEKSPYSNRGTRYLDYNYHRYSGFLTSVVLDGVDYDVTVGNDYVYDNINSEYLVQPQGWNEAYSLTGETVSVDVGTVWLKEVEIKDGNTVLFHGVPYSQNGVIGLYDEISETVKTLNSESSGTMITHSTGVTYDWISATTSGCGSDTLVITTSPNTGTTQRVGYVYVYSSETGNLLDTITVTQDGIVETLLVSPSTLVFDSNGGTATFTITSNTNWTIE